MGEKLHEKLMKAADVLHWLGKYDEANALILCSRLARISEAENLEQLEREMFVGTANDRDS